MTLIGNVHEFDKLARHALGWRGLLTGLRHRLDELSGDVRVLQVKEKFGGLRCYLGTDTDGELGRMVDELVDGAETASYLLCYLCGAGATHRGTGGWIRYFCDVHDTRDLYVALGRFDLLAELPEGTTRGE